MNKRANFFAIGLFVIVAGMLAAASVVIFGAGLLNKNTVEFIATFRGSANGLREGAKVKAYGVEVGSVKRVMLHQIEDGHEIVIPVLMEMDLDVAAELGGSHPGEVYTQEDYQRSLEAGIHAKLQAESLVTGMLYVELLHGLDREPYILEHERFAGYYNIPTVPTDLELMMKALESVVQHLGKTDIEGLVNESKGLVTDIRREVNAANLGRVGSTAEELLVDARKKINSEEADEIVREFALAMKNYRKFAEFLNQRGGKTMDGFDAAFEQLDSSLAELQVMSKNANVWLDPKNPMYNEIVHALDQLNDTSKALQYFLEYLERNPNALITGKPSDNLE